MKTIFLLLVAVIFLFSGFSAQNTAFKAYRDECSKSFGIIIKKPKRFNVIDEKIAFRVNEKKNIGLLYRLVLESNTKDSLILFPYFNTAKYHDIIAKNMVYGELEAAFNRCPDEDLFY